METAIGVGDARRRAADRRLRGGVGVVVVHGFTGTPSATEPLGRRLAAEGYRVEVPLLPGHATSCRDLAGHRYRDWAGAVEQRLDHLLERCERVVLVGHSMGGTIALDLASARPADVTAVAVINPLILRPSLPLAALAPVLQYVVPYLPRRLAGMPANDLARPGVEEEAYGLVPARAARSLLVELPRIRSQLAELVQPLLAVWSPQDHTVSAVNSRELLEYVGSLDVTQLVCERSYHLPHLDHDAAMVEDGIAAFVAEATGT